MYSRDMGRGNSREGGGESSLLSTEGVYSRDMGRGNSREGGGGGDVVSDESGEERGDPREPRELQRPRGGRRHAHIHRVPQRPHGGRRAEVAPGNLREGRGVSD